MDDKRNSLLTIGLVCAVLLVLGVADLWNSDRVYSEAENRVLASRPAFSWESLFTGEYGDAYEEYMSDQFVGRDKWVGLKTRADIRFRKKEINGVYLGADHYLIGVNDPGEYTEQMENSRVASLTKLVNHWDAKVMLVPTADNILTDKLPAFAPSSNTTKHSLSCLSLVVSSGFSPDLTLSKALSTGIVYCFAFLTPLILRIASECP